MAYKNLSHRGAGIHYLVYAGQSDENLDCIRLNEKIFHYARTCSIFDFPYLSDKKCLAVHV